MTATTLLKVLFACILVTMIAVTGWASIHQPIQQWTGLTGPDRFWTLATLMDAYCGFLTFYAWLVYKECRWLPRISWFIAIMLLGNIAMASYALLQLMRLRPTQGVGDLLTVRNS